MNALGTDSPVTHAIAQAYSNVMGRKRGQSKSNPYVMLAALRDALDGAFAREDVDAELDRLIEHPGVRIQAELNQKALTDRDRAAAVEIGGEMRDLISMEGVTDLPPVRRRKRST